MTGSSTSNPSIGQRVQITGVPQEWMQPLIGKIGTIGEIKKHEKVTAYRVDGLPGGPVWLGGGYLEVIEVEEKMVS